jgi:1,4-alpha-glucan branching enzyme
MASTPQSKTHARKIGLIEQDPSLSGHYEPLLARLERFEALLARVEKSGGLTGPISRGHEWFGFHRGEREGTPGIWYREWAPGAQKLSLIGDFNDWDRSSHPMARDEFGVWTLFLPDEQGVGQLRHGARLKVHVVGADGVAMDRIPAYIRRVEQEPHAGNQFIGVYWEPPAPFQWKHESPRQTESLRIYEAHVGMAGEEPKVSSYADFTRVVLPRVRDLGYNAIQLMAVAEHPYYGSFGYHVSSFFAPSSRFGTPEELKELIDRAHGMGIRVLLDIVHSHAVSNTHEGLNRFDGTEFQYFHAGGRGDHPAWGSKLFDYSQIEVLRFLLSNCRYWLEEFRFDGFRFDGVTSMLYLDHGLGKAFSSYDDYFGDNVDDDAVAYLQLANELIHRIRPDAVTVAEDVSGMPGMARPASEAGLGFDYRLAMGVPDFWIKTLKEKSDEHWSMGDLFHTLTNRRFNEKHVGYAESHDQAMVGDKTIAFWLMDKEMYWHMNNDSASLVIDRGIALHKMIRLVTFALAGEAWLNFMGNEFGHPEWIDFPREGNNNSYKYARRQWSLADNGFLRYGALQRFDQAMMKLDREHAVLAPGPIEKLWDDEKKKQLVFARSGLIFLFNFHPTDSWSDWRVPAPMQSDYRLILNTDERDFAGHGLVEAAARYPWQPVPCGGKKQSIQVYVPSRTALVLAPFNSN